MTEFVGLSLKHILPLYMIAVMIKKLLYRYKKLCKKCSQNKKIVLRSQQRFESEAYNVFTEQVNKFS